VMSARDQTVRRADRRARGHVVGRYQMLRRRYRASEGMTVSETSSPRRMTRRTAG
jgi:hypothetical protein